MADAAEPKGGDPLPPSVPEAILSSPSPRPRPVPRPHEDPSFPWSTLGRVDVDGGWASGVLVGPRHVLTASHVISWPEGDGPRRPQAGWLRFTPGASAGRSPFGSASAIVVHYAVAVLPPTIEPHEERHDYAVGVLDRRLGDEVGWLGVRAYDDAWDGHEAWTILGYAGTSAATARPVVADGLRLDGHDQQDDASQVIYHRAAVQTGHSGGPLIGRWSGEPAPHVVAVQSWANEFCAGACGGSRLVELVEQARRLHP
jgi:V8-like Glu-specific endopeptidase